VVSQRSLHWAWVILIVCFFDMFVNYSIRLGFGVVLPEMLGTLSLNRTEGGTIFNFYLASYICLTPFTGNLTDRFGARRVISGFGVFLGLGAVLMGTVESFWAACAFYTLVGVGASAMWTPVMVVIQRWFGSRRRGMALGFLSTGYGLGFAAVGLLFPLLVRFFSWRVYWYVIGGCALIMVLVNGSLLRSRPEDMHLAPWGANGQTAAFPDQKGPGSREQGRYGEILHSPVFWTIGASYFFVAFGLYIVTTFMVDYAKAELGFSLESASLLATIHGLSQVAGVLTIPMLSDRIGRRNTLMMSNLIVAVSILAIVVSGKSLWGLYASVAVMGLFYGVTWPMYSACGGDYFRKEVMGSVIGAWTPFYGVGAILAHFVGGRIRDVTQSFQMAFLLAVVLSLVGAFLMQRVRQAPLKA
jgi:sugar phosphate permease